MNVNEAADSRINPRVNTTYSGMVPCTEHTVWSNSHPLLPAGESEHKNVTRRARASRLIYCPTVVCSHTGT